MAKLRLHPPLLAALLLCVACGEAPKSGPITGKLLLRYHPPAGAAYGYTFEQASVLKGEAGPLAQMGEQRIAVAASLHQTVDGPVAEGIQVTMTLDSVRVEAPMVSAATSPEVLAQARGATTRAVYDDRMRTLRADPSQVDGPAAQIVEQLAAGLGTMIYAFPDSAVGAGDSWTAAFAVPFSEFVGGQPIEARTTLTVTGLELVRGDTVVHIAFDTKMPTSPFPVTVFGQPASVTLGGGISGRQTFSLSRGAIVSTTYAGKITVESRGSFLGSGTLRMGIDQQATLALDGAARGP